MDWAVMPSSLSLACAFLTRSFCLPAHSASSLPSRTYFMAASTRNVPSSVTSWRAATARCSGARQLLGAPLHAPPGEGRAPAVEPAVGLQAHRLEQHRHAALDMVPAIDRIGAPRICLGIAPPLIGQRALIGGVVGIGQLVILGFADAAERHGEAPQSSDMLAVEIALQMRVEELVVAQLVGGDLLADLAQHRLLGRLGERRVIGAGAGLDDAARHQFADARAADRAASIKVDTVSRGEARRRGGVIEIAIGPHGPAAERRAVLHLLGAPAARDILEGG